MSGVEYYLNLHNEKSAHLTPSSACEESSEYSLLAFEVLLLMVC